MAVSPNSYTLQDGDKYVEGGILSKDGTLYEPVNSGIVGGASYMTKEGAFYKFKQATQPSTTSTAYEKTYEEKKTERGLLFFFGFYTLTLGLGIKFLMSRGTGFWGYILLIFIIAPVVGTLGQIIGQKTVSNK